MICKKCGNNEFYATQVLYANVIVDGESYFIRNEEDTLEKSLYDGDIQGPYTCTKCGSYYDYLE